MGYAIVIGECGACHRTFAFNPLKVPSLNNVPFCKECIDAANVIRKERGMAPLTYAEDAYEAIPEEELPE